MGCSPGAPTQQRTATGIATRPRNSLGVLPGGSYPTATGIAPRVPGQIRLHPFWHASLSCFFHKKNLTTQGTSGPPFHGVSDKSCNLILKDPRIRKGEGAQCGPKARYRCSHGLGCLEDGSRELQDGFRMASRGQEIAPWRWQLFCCNGWPLGCPHGSHPKPQRALT